VVSCYETYLEIQTTTYGTPKYLDISLSLERDTMTMPTADDELAAFIGHREHHKKWERSDPTPTPTLAQPLPMPFGGELLQFPWSVVGRNDE
jgi:hypothetical protein